MGSERAAGAPSADQSSPSVPAAISMSSRSCSRLANGMGHTQLLGRLHGEANVRETERRGKPARRELSVDDELALGLVDRGCKQRRGEQLACATRTQRRRGARPPLSIERCAVP